MGPLERARDELELYVCALSPHWFRQELYTRDRHVRFRVARRRRRLRTVPRCHFTDARRGEKQGIDSTPIPIDCRWRACPGNVRPLSCPQRITHRIGTTRSALLRSLPLGNPGRAYRLLSGWTDARRG